MRRDSTEVQFWLGEKSILIMHNVAFAPMVGEPVTFPLSMTKAAGTGPTYVVTRRTWNVDGGSLGETLRVNIDLKPAEIIEGG